jgi:hypothetical protein
MQNNISAYFDQEDKILQMQSDFIIEDLKIMLSKNPSHIRIVYIRSHDMSDLRKRIRELLEERYAQKDICVREISADEETSSASYSIFTHYDNVGSLINRVEMLRQIKAKYPDFMIF